MKTDTPKIDSGVALKHAAASIQSAQVWLVYAGLGSSPTYYKLTAARLTIERRYKDKCKGRRVEKCHLK